MYLSLIISFLLLMGIVIAFFQNNMPLELKFITLNIQMPYGALILFFSLIGGAIVAVLALPKLARKSLDVRRLHKEIYTLKRKILEMEKGHSRESQTE
ncbi:MAG: LapA family protein [Desulfobacterales bacterium]|nr:LapA family protein [Desulfobacterales bacterium]